MGSLDVAPLSTNIPFDENTEACTNILFENIERVEDLSKIKFNKRILSNF